MYVSMTCSHSRRDALKYAVLGAFGQLGRDLCPVLGEGAIPLDRTKVDLGIPETIPQCLDEINPDVVVNCAAYNYVDKAETEPSDAMMINAWGLKKLSQWCKTKGKYLVHFSTDYVFGMDTLRKSPYKETDLPGPVSNYGISKLAGEFVVGANCPNHLIIRTCGLYGVWGSGGKGGNFVETMLRVAGQGKPLKVVSDQFCTPTYTKDLALVSAFLIKKNAQGLIHLTNQGSCSWYEFARAIFELGQVEASVSPISSVEYNAPALRPGYSVMETWRAEELGFSQLRGWRNALSDYLVERKIKNRNG